MDRISFMIAKGNDSWHDTVNILINNQNLVDLVKKVELPFATVEGSPSIAGGYCGLPPGEVLPPANHYVGNPHPLYKEGEKTVILVCGGCGESGCWPLLARIVLEPDRVIWSNFEQPHRGPESKGIHWDYRSFGPFIFSRAEYEQALLSVR